MKYREFTVKYKKEKWFYVDDVLSLPGEPGDYQATENEEWDVIEESAYTELQGQCDAIATFLAWSLDNIKPPFEWEPFKMANKALASYEKFKGEK